MTAISIIVVVRAEDALQARRALSDLTDRLGAELDYVDDYSWKFPGCWKAGLSAPTALSGDSTDMALAFVEQLGLGAVARPDGRGRVTVTDEDAVGRLIPGGEWLYLEVWDGRRDQTAYEVEELVPEPADPPLTEADLRELASLVEDLNATKVVLIVDMMGEDGVGARDVAKRIAALAGRDVVVADAEIEAREPEGTPEGTIRVGVVLGSTRWEPEQAVRRAVASLGGDGWSEPLTTEGVTRAVWTAREQPERGLVRLEVRAGSTLARD